MSLEGENCICLVDKTLMIQGEMNEPWSRLNNFADVKFGSSL